MTDFSSLLASCPGACGDLAREVNRCHKYDQPALALGAALSFCSMLKAGLVVSPTGFEPLIYVLLLADSGSGKSMVTSRISSLCWDVGLKSVLMGGLVSDAGFMDALREKERFYINDEVGEFFCSIAKNTQSFNVNIFSTMKKIWSNPNQVKGNRYSQRGEKTKVNNDIEYAAFMQLVATTADKFSRVLTSEFVRDGLLVRYLILNGSDTLKKHENWANNKFEIPASVSEAVRTHLDWELRPGNLNLNMTPIKKTIQFESPSVASEIEESIEAQLALYYAQKQTTKTDIIARKWEHMVRVAMAISGFDRIDTSALEWSYQFINTVLGYQIELCESKLGANEITDAKDKILELVPLDSWIKGDVLYSKSRNIKRALRRDCLEDLVDAKQLWVTKELSKRGGGRPAFLYTRSKVLGEQEKKTTDCGN